MANHDFTIAKGRTEIPCEVKEWEAWINTRWSWRNRVGPYTINTMPVGISHRSYETAAFTKHDHVDLRRWSTWIQARSAHLWIVHDFRKRKRRGTLDGIIVMPWEVHDGPLYEQIRAEFRAGEFK